MRTQFRRLTRAIHALGSPKLTTVLIVVLFLEVLWGTILEAKDGIWGAHRLVFGNWWGGVPLICTVAALNLAASLALRFRWRWSKIGLVIAHLGLVALLLSGGLGLAFSRESRIDLGAGETTSVARHPGRWEAAMVVHSPGGGSSRIMPLDGVEAGDVTESGGWLGRVLVKTYLRNGVLGMDGQPIPFPNADDPATRIPAIVLERTDSLGKRGVVMLDRNRPMASAGEGTMFFLQEAAETLPFQLTLKEFRRELHPGSSRAKSFESHVVVRDGSGGREAIIRMNHPLRLHGYTLYQSSWRADETKGVDRTILTVVRNPGGNWPYWSTLLIGLGLALHFLPRFRVGRSATAAMLLLAATAAHADTSAAPVVLPEVPPSLRALPIQVDGRVKTFETFAAHTLLQISGRSKVAGMDASRWLAAVLLEPDRVADLPVFLVENPDVRDALGLVGKDRDRHSWRKLAASEQILSEHVSMAASKPQEKRNAFDREVLRLSDALFRYRGIATALAPLRPESVAPLAGGTPPAGTLFQMALEADIHAGRIDSLAGVDSAHRTPEQAAILTWYRATFEQNAHWVESEFPVLPLVGQPDKPWGTPSLRVLKEGLGDSGLRRTMLDWDALRNAWLAGDAAASEAAARSLHDSVIARAGSTIRPAALRAEARYNALRPFHWAMLLFAFAFLPALFGLWKRHFVWIRVGDALSASAMLMLLLGMGLRMVVTLRPPVTNLYETFLFVAATVVPALVLPSLLKGWWAGSPLGALTGFVLLLLARGFGVDGDTMPVLVAVLDSNLWLAVHVLTITIGYGGVVAAGIAGHWHLWQIKRGQEGCFGIVRALAGFGLFFTFVGTLLGGIWADQSWGRFWGWDPKENGALLIVLWLAGAFHAKLSGVIGTRGFAAWTAGGISTVLFAWFGVNLLGVGLHSYGFTEGTFRGLAVWGVAEAVFLIWALRPGRRDVFSKAGDPVV